MIALLICCAALTARAQTDADQLDEIHLRSGAVFNGKILEENDTRGVTIRITTGDILEFRPLEIERVVRRQPPPEPVSNPAPDEVYLLDGTSFRGELLSYEVNGRAELRTALGGVLVFENHEIARVVQGGTELGAKRLLPDDEIFLKNGKSYRGELLRYEINGKVEFRTTSGSLLQFDYAEVKRVQQGVTVPATEQKAARGAVSPANKKAKTRDRLKEGTWYHHLAMGINTGGQANRIRGGGILQYTAGRLVAKQTGLGLGLGVESFSFSGRGERVYPLFVEGRRYLKAKDAVFYGMAQVGYGFAGTSAANDIVLARGGVHFNPVVGMVFNPSNATAVTLDFGYKTQRAFFQRETDFGTGLEKKRIIYNRWTFKIGLLF